MGLLSDNSCVAVTWSAEGNCHGVHLKKLKSHFEVTDSWASKTTVSQQNLSEVIAEALEALKPGDDTVVLIGGLEGMTFVDLTVPQLPMDALEQALQFEVEKYSPVPMEEIVWGFRIIEELEGNSLKVRLALLPVELWENWINAASHTPKGVDLLISADVTLDPIFKDKVVTIAGESGCFSRLFMDDSGNRQVELIDEDNSLDLLADLSSQAEEQIELGDLSTLPLPEKNRFSSALLMSYYGCQANMRKERRTWLKTPATLLPKKPMSFLVANFVLVVFVVVSLGWKAVNYIRQSAHENKYLKDHITKLEDQIKGLSKSSVDDAFLLKISTETKKVLRNRKGMANVLLELSQLLPEQAWLTHFLWNGERYTIKVRTEDENLDMAQLLTESGNYSNIQINRNVDSKGVTQITVDFLPLEEEVHDDSATDEKAGKPQPSKDAQVKPASKKEAPPKPVTPPKKTENGKSSLPPANKVKTGAVSSKFMQNSKFNKVRPVTGKNVGGSRESEQAAFAAPEPAKKSVASAKVNAPDVKDPKKKLVPQGNKSSKKLLPEPKVGPDGKRRIRMSSGDK